MVVTAGDVITFVVLILQGLCLIFKMLAWALVPSSYGLAVGGPCPNPHVIFTFCRPIGLSSFTEKNPQEIRMTV